MSDTAMKVSVGITEELRKEIEKLRITLEEQDAAFKAYVAEEVKRQVDERFEAYRRLLGMQVPTPLNRSYK